MRARAACPFGGELTASEFEAVIPQKEQSMYRGCTERAAKGWRRGGGGYQKSLDLGWLLAILLRLLRSGESTNHSMLCAIIELDLLVARSFVSKSTDWAPYNLETWTL